MRQRVGDVQVRGDLEKLPDFNETLEAGKDDDHFGNWEPHEDVLTGAPSGVKGMIARDGLSLLLSGGARPQMETS